MPAVYYLSRKQLVSSCRLNSIAVGIEIMTSPSMLTSLLSNRPGLKAYTERLGMANTLLVHANANLEQPLTEFEQIEWPDRNKIFLINALLQSNPELKITVQRVAAEIKFNLQTDNDPLGLLNAFDVMMQENSAHPAYSAVNDLIEKAETMFNGASKNSSKELTSDGITLDKANFLFFENETNLPIIAPAARTLSLRKIMDMGTHDKVEVQGKADEIFKKYLLNRQEDGMIQINTNRHAVTFGKTLGQYWKFNALDGDYATLTIYDHADDLLSAMPELARSADKGIEFAEVRFQLKDNVKDERTAAPVKVDGAALVRIIVDHTNTLESFKTNFAPICEITKLTGRYTAYLTHFNALSHFRITVEQLSIPKENDGSMLAKKADLLKKIDDEMLREIKISEGWKEAAVILQQIDHIKIITLPKTLDAFEPVLKDLTRNMGNLRLLRENFKTKNIIAHSRLEEVLDSQLQKLLTIHIFQPLAYAATETAKHLESTLYSEALAPEFSRQTDNLKNVINFIKANSNNHQHAIYSGLQTLHDVIKKKMPVENRLQLTTKLGS